MGKIKKELFKYKFQQYEKKWPNHWYKENGFGNFFRWKLDIENNNEHILDDNHRGETYNRLCKILPAWKTYRPYSSDVCLRRLRKAHEIMSDAYDNIRDYSLLEFSRVSKNSLKIIWEELGCVKEENGEKNIEGLYYIIAVCKPLMFLWGQTPAFDSYVRRNFLRDFPTYQKHCFDNRWNFEDWWRVMKIFQEELDQNSEVANFIREESLKIFGVGSTIPYGRFLDIYYYS